MRDPRLAALDRLRTVQTLRRDAMRGAVGEALSEKDASHAAAAAVHDRVEALIDHWSASVARSAPNPELKSSFADLLKQCEADAASAELRLRIAREDLERAQLQLAHRTVDEHQAHEALQRARRRQGRRKEEAALRDAEDRQLWRRVKR